MKLFITTVYSGKDQGDGGIRRIVEAQHRYLPGLGVQLVDSVDKADIVCSHAGDLPVVPVSKPWVVHCHGLYWAEYEWGAWAYKLNQMVIGAMRQADHVTAPSEWVAYALQRGMWLRPTVLYHGIDPETWQPGSDGGYVLWNKTRIDPICDPGPVNALAERLPKVPFVTTFGQARENVRVTGRLPFGEAKAHIRNADIYLATTRETMGIGTLEAMACGVPILGYNWGGQREIIEHKRTGWLVEPGDIAGLVEGYKWLKEHREEVGHEARTVCLERFTWPTIMRRYFELYERMLNKPKAPKVSVVMPAYNLARYLDGAIESVRHQTLKDWELIVVDDCSPDKTPEIGQAWAKQDKRIRYMRNEKNLYLAGALNAGMAASTGQYILPLDADNLLPPNALQALAGELDKRRDIAIAYGRVKFVRDDAALSPDLSVAPDGVSTWPPKFSYLQQIAKRNQIPSTCLFRREVWERTGGYRSRWRTAEDAAFWTHATSYGFNAAKVTEAVTLIYRNRKDSMSHTVKEPEWTAWIPWARDPHLIPFGAPVEWNARQPRVPICEPALVTVVIPVGPGHERIVIDAVDSVEAQTFRAWHCIVVNDTGAPLALPHPWVTMLATRGREGPAVARNMGIKASKTAAFVLLDADDKLEPEALEVFWSEYLGRGRMVYSQWFDDKGNPEVQIYDPPDWEPEYLLKKGCISAITALYLKSDWEAVGGFDPAMQNWEDWEFQIAMAAKNLCACKIDKPLWTYRKTTGSRRETALADYKRGRAEMMAKWGDYFEGRVKLMGCGGCGSRRSVPVTSAISGDQKKEGATLIQYVGKAPTLNVRGKETGKGYKFGQDAGHRVRWVFNVDVPGLLGMGQYFKLADEAHKAEPALK